MSDFSIAIVGSFFAALLWHEFDAWTPRIARRIAKIAASRAPENQKERLAEEWQAHLADTPGRLGPLFAAIGFVFATASLRREQQAAVRRAQARGRRAANLTLSLATLVLLSPLMLGIMAAIKRDGGGPALYRYRVKLSDGSEVTRYRFRTRLASGSYGKVGRFLEKSGLNDLPNAFLGSADKMDLIGLIAKRLRR